MIETWICDSGLSGLHTALCQRFFPEATRRLPESLLHNIKAQVPTLFAEDGDSANFWTALYNSPLGEFASTSAPTLLAPGIADGWEAPEIRLRLEECLLKDTPDLEQQLKLRIGPILGMWEAHGPGLLHQIRSLLGTKEMPAVRVHLLQPYLGGFGLLHHSGVSFRFEAVLANEDPRLPETLRLAWLCAQSSIAQDVTRYRPTLELTRRILGLAAIPATLQASEELGLSHFSPEMLASAVERWFPKLVVEPEMVSALYTRSLPENCHSDPEYVSLLEFLAS